MNNAFANRTFKAALGVIALVLLLLGFKNYYSDSKISNSHILNVEVIDPGVRGSGPGTNFTPYEKGLNAFFVKKDYKTAIKYFLESDSPAGRYFLGVSLLQNGDYKKAEIVFNQVLSIDNVFPYHLTTKEDIQWFLILSKLGCGEYETTQEIIAEVDNYLRNPSEKYASHAVKLREKLENPLYAFSKAF